MNKFKLLILLPLLCFGLLCFGTFNNASAKQAYDISQFQGDISNQQASNLKHEVNFTILRVQYGGLYKDTKFNHNAYEMNRNRIPYGAYDYSLYSNSQQAKEEADDLYKRAPQARFYVNDSEENRAGNDLDQATYDWASEIHHLTNKPAILYSDLSFMNNFSNQAREHYNALWLADYGSEPDPAYHYDLWQSTDTHYSPALGEKVDDDVFPEGAKSLSFWIKNRGNHYHKYITKIRVKKQTYSAYNHNHNFKLGSIVSKKKSPKVIPQFRIGSSYKARKSGFLGEYTFDNFKIIFDKYRPNSYKTIIPKDCRIIPNNTFWLIHSYTKNINVLNHIISNGYYYNNQHTWIHIKH